MKDDESVNPIDICFLRTVGKLIGADYLSDPIGEP